MDTHWPIYPQGPSRQGYPMDRQASLALLADSLTRLAAAPLDRSIIQKLPKELHSDAVDVLANVMHFIDDADIREKDERYKNMQETRMCELIDALRRGAPLKELLKYSFLQ